MHATGPFAADRLPFITQVYICRSSYSWPGDMAFSATYFPRTGFTRAIFYGCDKAATEELAGRLCSAEDALSHPMMLPGLFAELERKRQVELVTQNVKVLLETASRLSKSRADGSHKHGGSDGGADGDDDNDTFQPWLDVHHLKNGLEDWREQMLKMVDHLDELAVGLFAADD